MQRQEARENEFREDTAINWLAMTAVASATVQQAIGSNWLAVLTMTIRNNTTEKGMF